MPINVDETVKEMAAELYKKYRNRFLKWVAASGITGVVVAVGFYWDTGQPNPAPVPTPPGPVDPSGPDSSQSDIPEIEGPEQVDRDTLVRLSVAGEWQDYCWVVPAGVDGEEVIGDGSRYVFSAPPSTYRVTVVVLGGSGLEQASTSVTVGEGGVAPEPVPGPPTPGPAPALTGLAKLAYEWTAKVNSPDKAGYAHSLAKNFKSIAASIAAGAFDANDPNAESEVDHGKVLAVTKDLNRETLGSERDAWKPWLAQFVSEMKRREKSVVSKADYAKVWREVAAGLEAVR